MPALTTVVFFRIYPPAIQNTGACRGNDFLFQKMHDSASGSGSKIKIPFQNCLILFHDSTSQPDINHHISKVKHDF